jgi:enterochelin esterase family protein
MKRILFVFSCFAALSLTGFAQTKPVFDRETARSVKSVVEEPDGSVTFSIYAPMATTVTLTGDLAARDQVFTKSPEGIWSVKVTGVEPGSYRYGFNVDGLNVVDPLYPRTRDVLTMTNLTFGKGDQFWSVKDVPHGAMSMVYYQSKTTGQTRRMHVWTPAGYLKSKAKLPVFYLLHGGGDVDSGWPVIGCAGAILDNLLAEGKMVPMVVVMPDASLPQGTFTSELIDDIMPYIEANYRVKTGNANTALAGLSMGGIHILDILSKYPTLFKYVNIMSSGFFVRDDAARAANEAKLAAVADQLKRNVSYLRFTQGGPEDIAYQNGMKTLDIFKKYEIPFEYSEMPGGHNWYVWRFDLHYFAQKIFK